MNNSRIAPVILESYDPRWPEMFDAEKNIIMNAIGEHITSIEHIGSTAITGMVAKPEIDILIGVANLSDAEQCIEKLKKVGYSYYPQFEKFEPERRYFRKSSGITPFAHVHMYEQSNRKYKERIVFRDHLRMHPEVAALYGDHKRGLIKATGDDRSAYSDAKDYFVSGIIENLQRQGLL